ncbi:MAG: hypothetical protein LC107_14545, partial [Chitinophagales bacterium]|nr:hypothetical protein [Chitinophagales bacterium]
MRYAVIVWFVLLGVSLKGQAHTMTDQVRRLDSLVFYQMNVQAELLADSILLILNDHQEENNWFVAAFYKAELLGRADENDKALELMLHIKDQANRQKIPKFMMKSELFLELIYEIFENWELSKVHLDRAYSLYQTYQLDSLFSTYCIRKSSYFRFTDNRSHALQFAEDALIYAKRFNNYRDITDAYLLLGLLFQKENSNQAIDYLKQAAHLAKSRNDYNGYALFCKNVSKLYLENGQYDQSLAYSDSSMSYL